MNAQVYHFFAMDQAPNRIRLLRLRRTDPRGRPMSQQALADAINVSKVTISSLECGRMQLTLDYMRRIARVFGVTPVDLLNEDDQNAFLRTEEMDLVRNWREAGDVQRDMIRRVAEQRAPLRFEPPETDGQPRLRPGAAG